MRASVRACVRACQKGSARAQGAVGGERTPVHGLLRNAIARRLLGNAEVNEVQGAIEWLLPGFLFAILHCICILLVRYVGHRLHVGEMLGRRGVLCAQAVGGCAGACVSCVCARQLSSTEGSGAGGGGERT